MISAKCFLQFHSIIYSVVIWNSRLPIHWSHNLFVILTIFLAFSNLKSFVLTCLFPFGPDKRLYLKFFYHWIYSRDWAKTFQSKSKLMSVAVLLISRSMFRERTSGKQIIAITFLGPLIIFAIHQQFLSFAGVAAGVSPNQHQPLLAFSKFLSDVLKKGMSLHYSLLLISC